MYDYIPRAGIGTYIFTSRNPDCANGLNINIENIRVSSFNIEDGGKFVLAQLRSEAPHDKETQDAAEVLSERMGGLALGLKQMGGFIREVGCGINDLLGFLRDKDEEKELFADEASAVDLGYHHTLSSAWSVSLTALDPIAKTLLLMFALMDPDRIPEIITSSLRDICTRGGFSDIFPSKPTATR